jgi:hypothetical protein
MPYVRVFGSEDITVSVIGPENRFDRGNRRRNLIDSIRATELPQPQWFEIHLNDNAANVLHGLRSTDQVLRRSVAPAFMAFQSSRPVEEVVQWFSAATFLMQRIATVQGGAYLALSRVDS